MDKKCIVSFANSSMSYTEGLARLKNSLRYNFDGDLVAFTNETSIGSPLHKDNPYAFKVYCIQKAIDAGYKQILWLDSSCFAVAPVQPIFDRIEEFGYVAQDSGHWLGTWANDKSLKYFNMTRKQAMKVRMIGDAGFLGLNFDNIEAVAFFNLWKASMEDGIFKGAWTNDTKSESKDDCCRGHRHDMVCSSAIFHQMGWIKAESEELLWYGGPFDKAPNSSIIFKAQGL